MCDVVTSALEAYRQYLRYCSGPERKFILVQKPRLDNFFAPRLLIRRSRTLMKRKGVRYEIGTVLIKSTPRPLFTKGLCVCCYRKPRRGKPID